MTDRKKLEKYLIIGAIAIFAIVSVTYAFFQAQLDDGASTNVNLDTGTTDSLTFDVGDDISLSINQFNFGVGAGNLTSNTTASATLLANNASNTATYNYYVYFRINSNEFIYTTSDSKPEIILTVTDPTGQPVTSIDGLTYVQNIQTTTSDGSTQTVSGFDITTATGTFAVASAYSITANSTTPTTQNWEFTATFINLDSDQQGNTGKEMDAEIIIQEDELKPTLAEHIISLYTEDGVNGLYYHDGVGSYTNADQEAGDNSYRYSGANPNNYVCFGSDEETCPAENLYRIIGIFDDDKDTNYQIKLIKADYTTSGMLGTDGRDYNGAYSSSTSNYKGNMDTSTIATYRWNYDTSVSEWGANNWTTSEFNTINLNTNYWNYLGSTWQNLIAETTWHLGAMPPYNNTAKSFYNGERNNAGYGSNPITYSDEIGLMYPSDYGYAARPDAWATDIGDYDSSTITSNNWLYMGLDEWTVTPFSWDSYFVFRVHYNGYLNGNSFAYLGYAARPVFYLKSNVALQGGSG
ncbi:MAG TPA: hypothetical protein IAB40_01695, partial [Candidatus Onthocola stercoravium]|nr:hypothetical protein [Candidatus Onthocola stercoravium]